MTIRIRNAFLIGFVAIGIVPLIAFMWFAWDRTVDHELADVEQRHLQLAKNVAADLSRYAVDIKTATELVSNSLLGNSIDINFEDLMENLDIESIAIVSPVSGKIVASRLAGREGALVSVDTDLLLRAKLAVESQNFTYLPAGENADGKTVMLGVGTMDENLVFVTININYFAELAQRITFGMRGYTTIVDQAGNVLGTSASDSAGEGLMNISEVSAVRKLMKGETGIGQFYSPLVNSVVVTGLASVSGPGWGVLVPQPLNELYAVTFQNLVPSLVALIAALVGSLILLCMAVRWIALPLETFGKVLYKQSITGQTQAISPSQNQTYVHELKYIANVYNDLADRIRVNSEQQAKQLLEDHLTEIGNRTYFEQQGQSQIDARSAAGRKGVLIFFDLDGFKEINDTRGHKVGDEVLKSFARSLYPVTKRFMDANFRGAPAAHPIIGRIGGDEFAILLPLPEKELSVSEIGESLRKMLPKSILVEGVTIPCDQSAGGAIYPDQGTEIDELLRRADVALYQAKANGKNCFAMYDPKGVFGGKSETLTAVMNAIELDELLLEYQPKFCLKTQRVISVEALVRWNHPVHGKVPPNMFLPAIEKTHVMKLLGEWVVKRALKDLKTFDENGFELNVAINVGAEHFAAEDFVSSMSESCVKAEVKASRMQVEVTEGVIDLSKDMFSSTVKALQKVGFTVAIDDFGRGFSNLTRLAATPVDLIKLDGSLISNAMVDPRVKIILESAVEMAHALGSSVVVEGVETLDQVNMAEKAGADMLQGFYYSKSLAPEDLMAWLDKRSVNPQHREMDELRRSFEV